MIDKNGKLFGKISIIDIFVLLVVLGILLAAVYRFSPGNILGGIEGKNISYTVKIEGVRSFTYKAYEDGIGMPCFDKKTGQNIGTLKSVRQEPYLDDAVMSDGTSVLAEKPNHIVVYADIQASGSQTQTAYFANGTYEIKVGSEINLNTKYTDSIGKVYDVSID